MANRLEILSITAVEGRATATVALYFNVPVPQQSAMAADPARVVLGTKLSQPEIDAIKAGTIIQEIGSLDITGLFVPDIRAAMVALWQERRPLAIAAYVTTNRLVGDVWNDTPNWVNA